MGLAMPPLAQMGNYLTTRDTLRVHTFWRLRVLISVAISELTTKMFSCDCPGIFAR